MSSKSQDRGGFAGSLSRTPETETAFSGQAQTQAHDLSSQHVPAEAPETGEARAEPEGRAEVLMKEPFEDFRCDDGP